MRSLVVTLGLPLPFQGGGDLRAWSTIGGLMRLGPVAVFGVQSRPPEEPPQPGIAAWVTSSDKSLADPAAQREQALAWLQDSSGHPSDRWFSSLAARELEELAAGFRPDLVVLEHLWTRRYLDAARVPGSLVVLNANNVEAPLHEDLAAAAGGGRVPAALANRLAERVELIERATVAVVDQTWVPSERDAHLLLDRYGANLSVAVVPSGVDVERYVGPEERERRLMLYPGSFEYPPNAAAAERLVHGVLPAVRCREPDARLLFVGAGLATELSAAPGVEAAGRVPDVRPYLARASVMPVALDQGGGTRLKVLEGLAAGVPIVSTSKGVEGLELQAGEHVLIAESDDDLAQAVLEVWTHPGVQERLVEAGRTLVDERYGLEAVARSVADALTALGAPTEPSAEPS